MSKKIFAFVLIIIIAFSVGISAYAEELSEPDKNAVYVDPGTGERVYYDSSLDAYYKIDNSTGIKLYYDQEQDTYYVIDETTGEKLYINDILNSQNEDAYSENNTDEYQTADPASLVEEFYRVKILEIVDDEWYRQGYVSNQRYNYDFEKESFYYVMHDIDKWVYVDLLGAKHDAGNGNTYYKDPKTKGYYIIDSNGNRSSTVPTQAADDFTYMDSRIQILKCEVLNGPYKGEIINASHDISDTMQNDQPEYPAKVGETYMAGYFEVGDYGNISAVIISQKREAGIIWLGIVFILFLVFLGGFRSLRSVVALLLTLGGCILVVIPLISKGYDPVWVAIFFSISVIAATLTIVYGFSAKTLAAALGAASGVLVSGIIVGIMGVVLKMVGLVDGEAMNLAMVHVNGMPISLSGVLFASIMISVLGGTIDVGVSIASALEELHQKAPELTGAELMKSGVTIGVDIMQASLFTMITAFVGSTIHVLLLLYIHNMNAEMIINSELMMSELLRALAGSMGLLFTVPITSLISGLITAKGKFGKFSADCFASVVAMRRLIAKFNEKKQLALAKIAQKKAVEIPDNLFEIAQKNKKENEDLLNESNDGTGNA